MLTEVKIKSLQPREKPFKIADGLGLYLEIYPGGSKIWRIKYRVGGKETRKSLGHWPLVSLKTARELNEKRRFERKTGKQPPRESQTVAEACERWREKFTAGMAERTRKKLGFVFGKHIIPSIGHLSVVELTSETVLRELLRPIEDAGHREQAHRVKGTLSRVLRFAMAEGLIDRDVTAPLFGALAPVQRKHMATMTDPKKVGRLILDLRDYSGGPSVRFALRMLPYVFVRPGELRRAEWAEFDMERGIWRIPAERMKMRAAHLVPLSRQVTRLLEELKELTGAGPYLFPSNRSRTRPISDMAINAALRCLGYEKSEITGHGFRAMASTMLNERGYNSDWIERQLAHVESNGVRAAYNHADWLPERRKMMQDWADLLDRLAEDSMKS